jgi:2-keto-4-pentenoate hydratase/2-oxohepta-3-ene-1,7-dioic acid hydratase in catechol pathway
MQLCMYRTQQQPAPRVGLSTSDGRVYDLDQTVSMAGHGSWEGPADILAVVTAWDDLKPAVLAAAELAAQGGSLPVVPDADLTLPFPNPLRDAFAIGGNYQQHVVATSATTGLALTERKGAVFFMKPTGTFSGPSDPIVYDPALTQRLDYEVELGIVVGRGGRDIAVEDAMSHVFGYLVVNDVSARDVMLRNKPQVDHFRGKGMDTFFPMGPGVTLSEFVEDYTSLRLLLRVNGEVKQDAYASDMVRDVPAIIAELSKGMSLYAGDIIATGTPSGVQQEKERPVWLKAGDLVETEIVGLGRLSNRVQTVAG